MSAPALEDFDPRPHLLPSTRVLIRAGLELESALPSTNDRAQALARAGAPAGSCVVALEQTAGRGRRGRHWLSPAGAGLLVSFVLRPRMAVRQAPALTLAAAVAVEEAIRDRTQLAAGIKWPNDLLALEGPERGKKLCGILVELASDGQRIQHAVAGIGVNLREWDRPTEIADYATSLEALGAGVSPGALLATLADRLEARLEQLEAEGPAPLLEAWRARAFGIGREIALVEEGHSERGVFLGVADDGAILLRTAGGPVAFHSGELLLPGVPRPRDR